LSLVGVLEVATDKGDLVALGAAPVEDGTSLREVGVLGTGLLAIGHDEDGALRGVGVTEFASHEVDCVVERCRTPVGCRRFLGEWDVVLYRGVALAVVEGGRVEDVELQVGLDVVRAQGRDVGVDGGEGVPPFVLHGA